LSGLLRLPFVLVRAAWSMGAGAVCGLVRVCWLGVVRSESAVIIFELSFTEVPSDPLSGGEFRPETVGGRP